MKKIQDRFYKDLEFGTGGLHGIMGASINCGQGKHRAGRHLSEAYTAKECAERGVAVTYDTRNHSWEYAQVTADVLSGMGIKVYLMKEPRRS